MLQASSFYNQELELHKAVSKQLKKRLNILSLCRFGVFLISAIAVYMSLPNWQLALVFAVVGLGLFLLLLLRYTDIKDLRKLHQRLVEINSNEIMIANGAFHHLPNGLEFQNPKHAFSLDIDMFGRGSFFQYLNRTTIEEGTQVLVNHLLSNSTSGISQRQEAINELSQYPKWMQKYSAISKGIKVEFAAASIISWLTNYNPFLKTYHYWLSIGFSLLSLAVLALTIIETIPINTLIYLILIGLGITGYYLKRISILAQHTSKVKDTFKQYSLLLEHIEQHPFNSQLLKNQQEKIKTDDVMASKVFRQFSKALDALDNRNNLISAIFGNGYLLWDIRTSYLVERWIEKNSKSVSDWFDVVTYFDAYNSLGTFAFNHQNFVFPEIAQGHIALQAKDLGHPLLDSEKRITSDVTIENKQFFIVTGANMAGKSTFLRTVALHHVMANSGLPVCAKESKYKPIKLITSMRTTDSLTDDSSYFFSELTRLKMVVDTLKEDSNYFVILDEILKGTNSTDKAKGSWQFVERLFQLGATGIIATHDLSLTDIVKKLKTVENYFFDAQIISDELYFDYKLKKGICQNMNASFLLKKMEIV